MDAQVELFGPHHAQVDRFATTLVRLTGAHWHQIVTNALSEEVRDIVARAHRAACDAGREGNWVQAGAHVKRSVSFSAKPRPEYTWAGRWPQQLADQFAAAGSDILAAEAAAMASAVAQEIAGVLTVLDLIPLAQVERVLAPLRDTPVDLAFGE